MERRVGTIRFRNKKTVKPEALSMDGLTLTFSYAGIGDDGEAFPGQRRWMPDRKHDDELPGEQWLWFPDEDIEWMT